MFTKARLLPFLKRGLSCDLVRPSLLCGGALVGLQRRPRRNPTSVPLGCNKGPVARCRPLFGCFSAAKNSCTFSKIWTRGALIAPSSPPWRWVGGGFLLSFMSYWGLSVLFLRFSFVVIFLATMFTNVRWCLYYATLQPDVYVNQPGGQHCRNTATASSNEVYSTFCSGQDLDNY